jgi:uncharacterized protein
MTTIPELIALELSVNIHSVNAAIELLDEGSTVPFIARYRKEKTGGLDDTQLRLLDERLGYLRELDKRRNTILKSIDEQGKLTPALEKSLLGVKTKTELEDLYLPYKPKRRTRAQMAREAGLQKLADSLLANPVLEPESTAKEYINPDKDISDIKSALDGARQILMEQFAENAQLTGQLRDYLWKFGVLSSKVLKGKDHEGKKFSDYFSYSENINKIPSHRALALFRGRNEGFLKLTLDIPVEDNQAHPCEEKIAQANNISDQGRAGDAWLLEAVRWAWKVKIHTRLDVDLMMRLREIAEQEAIRVFSTNLKDLLLAAPAGAKTTMGLDPGIRTGVKVTVVDETGKLLDTATIYPHQPRNQWDESIETLQKLIQKHEVVLVSIGNGTASRETDKLVTDLLKRYPNKILSRVMVSEAGASVYSASELAAREFPELDVSLRGAVSIARRLQDPLAELVKIDPKSIGVGQYQHDVNQVQLARSLDAVVEDCVNAVGVDVNMASAPLLAHVSGLNVGLAENIVAYRNEKGAFNKRSELKKVARLGPKAFEQAAGFLRIPNGCDPLDASAVHPEAAGIVKSIAQKNNIAIKDIIGNSSFISTLKPQDYTNETFGIPTVKDIFVELEKPGRDPRPEFTTATFQEGIDSISDLQPDMMLEGVVTNVTNFGAFVDIGVHQDGLVHISKLADHFVKDPHDVVKAGEIVKVKVEEIDISRKRISLSMKLKEIKNTGKADTRTHARRKSHSNKKFSAPNNHSSQNTALAEAFLKAKK